MYDTYSGNGGFRTKVRRFGFRYALSLTFLAIWGAIFFIGEVILRYVVH